MKRIVCTWGAAILLAAPLFAKAAPIETIQVQLHSVGSPLPIALEKRMEMGIRTASEHILVGKDDQIVTAQLPEYNRVGTDVLNRILYGYTVDSLQIQPGPTTTMKVQVKPYGPVVENVKVTVDYGNLSPVAQALVASDIKGIETTVNQILLGASLDSLDWAGPVVQDTIRTRLQRVLPEFIPQVDIKSDATTQVHIYLVPQGEIVRHTQTEITSDSLPRVLFVSTKEYGNTYLSSLEGLPSAFVARHQADILRSIDAGLLESRAHSRFGVNFKTTLETGRQVTLLVHADTSRYIVRGEGYLDMGRKENNTGIKAHVGYRSGKSEWFLETDFYPSTYTWKFYPSYMYHLTRDTRVAYQYGLREKDSRVLLEQDLGDRFHLRAQRDLKAKHNEFGISYDLHSYASIEYIFDNDSQWLRIIGHI